MSFLIACGFSRKQGAGVNDFGAEPLPASPTQTVSDQGSQVR